jgi:hypothetical protein
LFFGSNFAIAAQFEMMSVHWLGLFKSMNRLYSPAGTLRAPNMSGTSVFSRVETFAPARQTGGAGRFAEPTSFSDLP